MNLISSAGASSPAVPTNIGSVDGSIRGLGSKAASLSYVGSQPPQPSLSTGVGGSAFGMSRNSCRPWERGDLLRRLATFKPGNWFGKPKVIILNEYLHESCSIVCDFACNLTITVYIWFQSQTVLRLKARKIIFNS